MSHPPLPSSYEGLLLEARSLQEAGQVAEAIARYEYLLARLARLSDKIVERRPSLLDIRKQAIADLIPLLRWEHRLAEAIEQQQTLLALDPERAALWRRELASLRVEKGEVDAGLAALRALAEEEPADPWTWLALGHEPRLEGRFAEAQRALDRALEAARSSQDNTDALATAHYERFRLFKEKNRWEDAVAAWEQAITLQPKALDGTVSQVVKMLTDAGLYGMARPYVDRDPNPIRAGLQRGLLDYMTGKAFGAMQAWQQAAALDPREHPGGEEAWMEAALRAGKAREVTERADELTARHPSTRSLTLAGMAWAAVGNGEAAHALLEQALMVQRRQRPVRQKLEGADWRLLNSVVQDNNIKSALRPFFAVIETTWDQAMP
jgi:tetratricopeptide (TPR) repeat protein